MQTIQEIADELKVTPQAVYKRLKVNGIKLDELKPIKEGKKSLFDEWAADQIKRLFNGEPSTLNKNESTKVEDVERLKREIDELKARIEGLEDQLREAQAATATAQERAALFEGIAADLRQQVQHLMEQAARLTDAVQAAQLLQAQAQKIAMERRPLLARIRDAFRHGSGKDAENVPL